MTNATLDKIGIARTQMFEMRGCSERTRGKREKIHTGVSGFLNFTGWLGSRVTEEWRYECGIWDEKKTATWQRKLERERRANIRTRYLLTRIHLPTQDTPQYSVSPLNRHYPLTVALNLKSRVILGLVIPDQKFVATSSNISRNLVQNLTRTVWESGIFYSYLVTFLLHWFKEVNPETYLLKCLESAYIALLFGNNHPFFIDSFGEAG